MYRRNYPLYRQAGGPIMGGPPMGPPPMGPPPSMGPPPMGPPPSMGPPPMGPPMGPPPSMGPPPMEGIEAAFAQRMSQNVEGATNTEELIDAIRGNAKPLQARYDELAQYVGQQDAHQTPETVLALVQPTLLMTEQGIMESGVEQLLGQIPPTGDPAMGPPPMGPPPMGPPPMGPPPGGLPGGPPPMGPPPMGPPPMGPPPMGLPPGGPPIDRGVGALLGPGMTPPLPQMAVGGAIKKLQGGSSRPIQRYNPGGQVWALGGDPPEGWENWGEEEKEAEISRLAELYGEDYQTIKEIMAPTEQQNRLARSQLFFDAARAGLNLAANRDAQGNPLRGSTASKFAAVTEPVLAGVPKASKAALSAAGEAAAKQAAITSALARRTTEDATKARREEAALAAEADIEAARIAATGKTAPAPTEWTIISPDGDREVINARNPREIARALGLQNRAGYTIHIGTANIPTGALTPSEALGVFANPDEDMWNRVELNRQTFDDIALIQGAWEELTRQIHTGGVEPVGGLPIYAPASEVPDQFQQIINEHVKKYSDSPFTKYASPGITFDASLETTAIIPGITTTAPAITPDTTIPAISEGMSFKIQGISPAMTAQLEGIIGRETDPAQSFTALLDGLDPGIASVYGIGGALTRFMTETAGALFPPFRALDEAGAADARSALEGFTTMSALAMAEAMDGRVAQQTIEHFRLLFPEVSAVFTNVPEAIGDYKYVLSTQQEVLMIGARQLAAVQIELDAGSLSEAVRSELRKEQRTYERALPIVALSMIKIDGIIKRLESGEAARRGESISGAPPDAVLTPDELEKKLAKERATLLEGMRSQPGNQ